MGTVQRFERLELKYHISERLAEQIRKVISPWCVPDAFNGATGYPIASLYLDTPTLEFHRARLRSDLSRFKLRIRTYGAKSNAHFEIKRKVGKIINKSRSAVPREQLDDALAGRINHAGISMFESLRLRYGAEPKLTVYYQREAYTSTVDHYARITFDRNIQATPAYPSDWTLHASPNAEKNWYRLDHFGHLPDSVSSSVLLELKCESHVPRWMSDLITRFELSSTGFSKYSRGVEVCGLGTSHTLQVWRP